jgi:hypothetical protein
VQDFKIIEIHRENEIAANKVFGADLASTQGAKIIAAPPGGGHGTRIRRSADLVVVRSSRINDYAVLQPGPCDKTTHYSFRRW